MSKKIKRKWVAFLIIGCMLSVELYLFGDVARINPRILWLVKWLEEKNCWIAIYSINLAVIIVLIRCYIGEPLQKYGFHIRKSYIQFVCGMSCFFLLALLEYPTDFITRIISALERIGLEIKYGFTDEIIMILIECFIMSVLAEIVFRGYVLSFFREIFVSQWNAVFLSALLYAVSTYPSSRNIYEVMYEILIGISFGFLRIKAPEKFTVYSLALVTCLNKLLVMFA